MSNEVNDKSKNGILIDQLTGSMLKAELMNLSLNNRLSSSDKELSLSNKLSNRETSQASRSCSRGHCYFEGSQKGLRAPAVVIDGFVAHNSLHKGSGQRWVAILLEQQL